MMFCEYLNVDDISNIMKSLLYYDSNTNLYSFDFKYNALMLLCENNLNRWELLKILKEKFLYKKN